MKKHSLLIAMLVVLAMAGTNEASETLAVPTNEANAFAFDLLEQLHRNAPNENVVFSPYSLLNGMGMVEAASDGETRKQIKSVLNGLDTDQLAAKLQSLRMGNFLGMRIELQAGKGLMVTEIAAGRPAEAAGFKIGDRLLQINGIPLMDEAAYSREIDIAMGTAKIVVMRNGQRFEQQVKLEPIPYDGKKTLQVANALWAESQLKQEFAATIATAFDAEIRTANFSTDGAKEVGLINQWVNQKTEGMIPSIFERLEPTTRCVAVNAVHFKSDWQFPFDKMKTADAVFHGEQDVTLPMMHLSRKFYYTSQPTYQMLQLPYQNRYSMYVCLPTATESMPLAQLEKDFAVAERFQEQMRSTQVNLTMPRFQASSSSGLKSTLMKMGMVDAFSKQADFSRMSADDLMLDDIIHRCRIDLDEKGTEAAAVTAAVFGVKSLPAKPVEFTVDRPFLFMIVDEPTHMIAFMGWVNTPVTE